MRVKRIFKNDDLNNTNEQNVLPERNHKREAEILIRIDDRLKKKHELCDHLITIVMKHRQKSTLLIDDIRKKVLIRDYDKADEMLKELETIIHNLRNNSLLKNIGREINRYL